MNAPRDSASVVIAAYNVETCLERAVKSALEQRPPPFEVIVIDDGSNDRTAEVARSFGDRVRLVDGGVNQGPAAARNRGLRLARGEFIAFLDADDYWLPGFLRECLGFLDRHTECIAVNTSPGLESGVRDKGGDASDGAGSRDHVPDNFFSYWAEHYSIMNGTCLIRSSAIREAGEQRELRVGEDIEYWGCLGTCGRWGFLDRALWVNDSSGVAARTGWLEHFRPRRKACPTVEQWQSRLITRLRSEDWPGFRRIRGRVAAAYAHEHLLAGRILVSRGIVREFGADMPRTPLTRLLYWGDKFFLPGWLAVCAAVTLREYLKAFYMTLRH